MSGRRVEDAPEGQPVTLFEHEALSLAERQAPLATRMRPRSFDELVGQAHLIGPGRALRKSVEADRIPSMVLWGPPGSGKTTLARLIASVSRGHFSPVSAVGSGVADLRRAIEEARDRLGMHGRRTILFIDEIHRFNKAQQDVILPHVEDGTVILIGSTTENPSFEVNSPLLSRSRVFRLNALTDEQLAELLLRSVSDRERGLGEMRLEVDPDALKSLAALSGGDARVALNALELAAGAADPAKDGRRRITVAVVEDAMQQRALLYDRAGDQHYDTISAFIKSLRGADPNAAVYWLARMIEAGEDPQFIARRLVILAAEDVGLADPQALQVAVAAHQAVRLVGMPEGRIPLAEAAVYLAAAPKSNAAYAAIDSALEDVRATGSEPVPMHLRNAVTGLMRGMGYGKGYRYAHDYEDHFAPMQNLPERLEGRRYYTPTGQGYEAEVAARLAGWWGSFYADDPDVKPPNGT